MALKYYAVLDMDDYSTTQSSGGIVKDIVQHKDGTDENTIRQTNVNSYRLGDAEKTISIDEETYNQAKVGWIYQDKTNLLRDPNS